MSASLFDEEVLNTEIRKFLKKVGITSQIEIENAVRAAATGGTLDASRSLRAVMTLEVPALGLSHRIEGEIALS